jgi:1-aminocyclopropane-1-carboxylate deaminase/D-cysteine desulfhydrase-like pyridoxal-dependent ACC family enzyme
MMTLSDSSASGSVRLGTWPTPLEPMPRLARALGLGDDDLWIKRDDLTGLGGGGNKVRKLEWTCGAALADGATVLVTTGAPQSNHARLTAAAAARTEGIVLDPIYTGRALAGLIAAVRDGDIAPGQRTIFLHSGGLPGLFGHPAALAQAEAALIDFDGPAESGEITSEVHLPLGEPPR